MQIVPPQRKEFAYFRASYSAGFKEISKVITLPPVDVVVPQLAQAYLLVWQSKNE